MSPLLITGLVLLVLSVARVILAAKAGGPAYEYAGAFVLQGLGLSLVALEVVPESTLRTVLVVAFGLGMLASIALYWKLSRNPGRR